MTGIHSHPAPLIVAKPLFVATTRQKYLLLLFDRIIMMDYLSFHQWRSGRDWSPRTQNPDKPAFSVGCSASRDTIQFNNNMSQWSIRDCNSSRNFSSNYYEWVSSVINPQIQCNKLISSEYGDEFSEYWRILRSENSSLRSEQLRNSPTSSP